MLLNNDITHHFSEFISIYKKTPRMQTAAGHYDGLTTFYFAPGGHFSFRKLVYNLIK